MNAWNDLDGVERDRRVVGVVVWVLMMRVYVIDLGEVNVVMRFCLWRRRYGSFRCRWYRYCLYWLDFPDESNSDLESQERRVVQRLTHL